MGLRTFFHLFTNLSFTFLFSPPSPKLPNLLERDLVRRPQFKTPRSLPLTISFIHLLFTGSIYTLLLISVLPRITSPPKSFSSNPRYLKIPWEPRVRFSQPHLPRLGRGLRNIHSKEIFPRSFQHVCL